MRQPASFFIQHGEGPLVDGERNRATEWEGRDPQIDEQGCLTGRWSAASSARASRRHTAPHKICGAVPFFAFTSMETDQSKGSEELSNPAASLEKKGSRLIGPCDEVST